MGYIVTAPMVTVSVPISPRTSQVRFLEQGQRLPEGVEGEPEELPGAFAGDAELEAGVPQLGFVEGEGGGGIRQGVVEADDIGEARRQEEGEPVREVERRRAPFAGGAGVGGHARQERAIVGVELVAGRKRLAQVAEGREAAGAQGGENSRGQAAGLQGTMAKAVRVRKWNVRRGHRFGAVEEASSASYSAAVSSFSARTRSRRDLPEARASCTSWATRS